MRECHQRHLLVTRREVLQHASSGLGMLALAAMAAEAATRDSASDPLAPRTPHFKPRAKHVVFIWQGGGPPHQDTFDPKPLLKKNHGKQTKEFASILGTRFKNSTRKIVGSPWEFKPRGESGLEMAPPWPIIALPGRRIASEGSGGSPRGSGPSAGRSDRCGERGQSNPPRRPTS